MRGYKFPGMDLDMDYSKVFSLLKNPEGVADLLTETNTETGNSPADVLADVVNVIRADTKMLGKLHGIDIKVKRMSPERAAELLAGSLDGGGVELIEVFNELEDQRSRILSEALPATSYQAYLRRKRASLYTNGGDDPEDDPQPEDADG